MMRSLPTATRNPRWRRAYGSLAAASIEVPTAGRRRATSLLPSARPKLVQGAGDMPASAMEPTLTVSFGSGRGLNELPSSSETYAAVWKYASNCPGPLASSRHGSAGRLSTGTQEDVTGHRSTVEASDADDGDERPTAASAAQTRTAGPCGDGAGVARAAAVC